MDKETRSDFKILSVLLIVAVLVIVAALVFGGPLVTSISDALAPGLGIKDAAIWAFGATFVIFIVFAVAAGDGLIGEIQYMLLGFFAFFVIITLLIAWVF